MWRNVAECGGVRRSVADCGDSGGVRRIVA